MTLEQGKGSDPSLFEDYHHAWLPDLASLTWWITETRQQSSGEDADCLFHSGHAMHHMKEKNRPHGHVAIKVGQRHANLYYV